MLSRKRKRLCIVGSAPSKADAPYGDKSFDIWAISGAVFSESLNGVKKENTEDNSWNDVTRYDVLFEMHKRNKFLPKLAKLAECGKPVIMQRVERDIPTSQSFPLDEVSDAVGADFFCTISYMLAYAIYLGYEEIKLYGIIMAHETEYIRQRPSVKFYLGIAHARGVKVWAPEETQLTHSAWRYGYDDHDDLCGVILARKADILREIEAQKKVQADANATLWQLSGGQIACENLLLEIKGGL
ncbi:MAG: hypothetical protein WC481_07610 [Candidatus Omnitrophota bacterium]